jgi:hypothetical protein
LLALALPCQAGTGTRRASGTAEFPLQAKDLDSFKSPIDKLHGR